MAEFLAGEQHIAKDSEQPPKFDDSSFFAAAKALHNSGGKIDRQFVKTDAKRLINEINSTLWHGVESGIQTTELPAQMYLRLKSSTFVFSGFKALNQMRQASTLLLTDEGDRKPWDTFKRDIQSINKQYNVNYLSAEYNFAIASGQMASKWSDIEQDGDRYNLQYRTTGDERVRGSHAAINGVTLPPSDPFWDKFYPPNGWGCRCNVVQVLKDSYKTSNSSKAQEAGDRATTNINKNGTNTGAIFRFNPGKSGNVFPPKHPYFNMPNVEKAVEKLFMQQHRNEIKDWAKDNLIGKQVNQPNIPSPIGFTVTGIKEALNQPHKHYIFKNEAVKNIEELIEKAEYLGAKNVEHPKADKFYYLKTKIADEPSFIVIKQFKDDIVFYTITDKIKTDC